MGVIRLQVISLEGEFLDESVDFFKFQGPMGETAILRNHAPLLTIFNEGLMTYKTQSQTVSFYTLGGLIEIKNNEAVLLADYCSNEKSEELTLLMKEKAQNRKLEHRNAISFHQLYAQLAQSPFDMRIFKGIGKRK
jgi:F-type H+-transporting ATPase subunit epsilon